MRFGLIGPGTIAAKFAEAAKQVEGVELVRIASSDQNKAEAFAREHGTGMPCTYDYLLNDETIDAVYISTINTRHFEMAKKCLEAGKAVLCEKPLCPSFEETDELLKLAEDKNLLFMEAMWTLHLPVIHQVETWIREGRIGDLAWLNSSFSFYNPTDPKGRLFDPAKAGGGLYDVGIYNIAFSLQLADDVPTGLSSALHMGKTGVDTVGSILMTFPTGAVAQCQFGVQGPMNDDAQITGDHGYIEIPHFFMAPEARLYDENHNLVETVRDPRENGFTYEIEAFRDAFLAGQTEVAPTDHMLTRMCAKIIDEIRTQSLQA